VKVPRSELSKLTNVQELVDMLYNVLQQQGQQAQGAS
jgi:acyl carrier protein